MDVTRNIDNTLEVRLARSAAEVAAAQALRYRVFYENMGALPSAAMAAEGRDFDRFDAYCDHLLVLDHADGPPARVVGTYRLLRRSRAEGACGFYSSAEFDLSALDKVPGEVLELGRSCVDPDYRARMVLQSLWQGIADYLMDNRIVLMFGCASFPGTDLDGMSQALSYLAHHHSAPEEWRPRALAGRYVEMDRLPREHIDVARALREMPPLIKGYLRIGGVIGKGAVIDDLFNTLDVCLLVETARVPARYMRHYGAHDMVPTVEQAVAYAREAMA